MRFGGKLRYSVECRDSRSRIRTRNKSKIKIEKGKSTNYKDREPERDLTSKLGIIKSRNSKKNSMK
jgi:hypothetical protein